LSNQTDNWFCQCCLQAIFPYNHFDDELDFINCIFTHARCDKLNSLPIRNCTQLDIISKLTAVDKNIDPDKNLVCVNKDVLYYTERELNERFAKDDSDYKISLLHINARSINKNIDSILLLLNNLTISFKIIAVTETWIDDTYNQTPPQIPGYTCHSKPRNSRRGGFV